MKVEWTVAGIEPTTFRLQGYSPDYTNRPQALTKYCQRGHYYLYIKQNPE